MWCHEDSSFPSKTSPPSASIMPPSVNCGLGQVTTYHFNLARAMDIDRRDFRGMMLHYFESGINELESLE